MGLLVERLQVNTVVVMVARRKVMAAHPEAAMHPLHRNRGTDKNKEVCKSRSHMIDFLRINLGFFGHSSPPPQQVVYQQAPPPKKGMGIGKMALLGGGAVLGGLFLEHEFKEHDEREREEGYNEG